MSPPGSPRASAGGDVEAELTFLLDDGQAPFSYTYRRQDGGPQSHGDPDKRIVKIRDARQIAAGLSLDRNGVMLAPHCTALSTADFYESPERVLGQYYEEMRALVRRATGASRVVVFDHNVRNSRIAREGRGEVLSADGRARNAPVAGYAMGVHNDYTDISGAQRIRLLTEPSFRGGSYTHLGEPLLSLEEAEGLLRRRYIFINVWRNISEEPVAKFPFAVCDGSSIEGAAFVRSALIFPDRAGETFRVKHDPAQQWIYFGGLRRDEAILLKVMDSKVDADVVRYTAHSAFWDPRSTPADPPRESIEARCIVFFDDADVERTAEPAAALFPAAKL